jgi:hypothetical protein
MPSEKPTDLRPNVLRTHTKLRSDVSCAPAASGAAYGYEARLRGLAGRRWNADWYKWLLLACSFLVVKQEVLALSRHCSRLGWCPAPQGAATQAKPAQSAEARRRRATMPASARRGPPAD